MWLLNVYNGPFDSYPVHVFLFWKCLLFTSAAYIQLHFRLDFFSLKLTILTLIRLFPWEQSDMGSFCLQYRLTKKKSRRESRQQKSWLRHQSGGKLVKLNCITEQKILFVLKITHIMLNTFMHYSTLLPSFYPVNLQHSSFKHVHDCIYKQSGKQCGSWSDGFIRSDLIWIYSVFKQG